MDILLEFIYSELIEERKISSSMQVDFQKVYKKLNRIENVELHLC